MLIFLFAHFINCYFYYTFRGITELCPTLESLMEKINSFQYEYSALPEITIDEDLDLSCNDLPTTWILAMWRKTNYPYYLIRSNSTEKKSQFILDTTSSSDDNCPGFRFENLSLFFKGRTLKTTRIELDNNVDVKIENRNFHLYAEIGSMSLSQISSFSSVSFARLTLSDDYEDNILDVEQDIPSDDDSNQNPALTLPNQNNGKYGYIGLDNFWAEPSVFQIEIKNSTKATFDNDTLTIETVERPPLIVSLPTFNYSNAFYFHLTGSDISFEVEGNLNYSSHYPHGFYIIQSNSAINLNVTIGPGNYLNAIGEYYDDTSGSLFSLSLHDCILNYNNPAKIYSLHLANVVFRPIIHDITLTTFYFEGRHPVEDDLNLVCNTIEVATTSAFASHLTAVEGKKINITVNTISSIVSITGDVYLINRITIPNSQHSNSFENLHFVNTDGNIPLIEIGSPWSSNAERPIVVTGAVFGKAGLIPRTTTKSNINYICGNLAESSYIISYGAASVGNVVFEPQLVDDCMSAHQTVSTPQTTLTICFSGESSRCPTMTTTEIPYGTDDWSQYYNEGITSIEFQTRRDVTIDLSPIKSDCQISFMPNVPLFGTSPGYIVKLKTTQEASDHITECQFGSTTPTYYLTIHLLNTFKPRGDVTLQRSVTIDPENFAEFFDPSNLNSFGVEVMAQLTNLTKIIPKVNYLFVNSKETITYIEYTDSGWKISAATSYFVPGFHHKNFTLRITATSSSTKKVLINVTSQNPYHMYLLFVFSMLTTNIAQLAGDWTVFEIPPIIIDGGLMIETPYDTLPVNLDDRLIYHHQIARRLIAINKTGTISHNQVITIDSPLYMSVCTSIQFDQTSDETLNIIFTKPVERVIAISTASSRQINLILRSNMTVDGTITRFWSESNMIHLVKDGTLNLPSMRDSIISKWDYFSGNKQKVPSITQADALIRAKYIIMPQNYSISQEEIDKMRRFYFILSATNDMTFEETLDKIEFENDTLALQFLNQTVHFELYTTYMFEFEPDEFDENGIVESLNAIMVGVYLKRLDGPINDGIEDSNNKGLNTTEIAGIAMGAICATLIIIVIVSSVISKRKSKINGMINIS